MKYRVAAFLLLLCCLLLPQAVAANAPGELHIFMQLDNPDITINGTVTTVETAPFVDNGTTLVPLRVISTAFGSVPVYNAEDRSILLPFADKTVKLWIGRTDTEINGVPAQPLLTAPRELNGRTMVPIRFIAETFGAVVNYNAEDRTITIIAQFATTTEEETTNESPGTPSTPNLDVDAGKTKIGNSHHGWSMNYPANLVLDYISFGEEYVYFTDLNGEFELYIDVEYDQDDLTKEALLRNLADDAVFFGEQILEQTTVNGPNGTYAKIVAKGDDYISEYRAFQVEDRIYTIELYVIDANNYRNSSKYAAYATLLDSFKPFFDRNDPEIKDLSTIKDGFKHYVNEDFGISLGIPSTWYDFSLGHELYFENEDETEYVNVRVTSLSPGDTMSKWLQRSLDYYRSQYMGSNLVIEEEGTPISLSGTPANLIKLKVNFGLGNWTHVYDIYAIVGDYKYEIVIGFTKSGEQLNSQKRQLAERILQSIRIHEDAGANLGFIQDDQENFDRNRMTERKFRSMNLSIRIPDHWEQADEGSEDTITYSTSAGLFQVLKIDIANTQELEELKNEYIDYLKETWVDLQVLFNGPMEQNGLAGWKIVATAKMPETYLHYFLYVYLLGSGDNYYMVLNYIPIATATPANMDMFETVLDSIKPLQ